MTLERWLLAAWYGKGAGGWILAPLGWLMRLLGALRRLSYRSGLLPRHSAGVPVIVVGNITVGGTGKTPLVIWLVERLREAGLQPGVLTRGYGGRGGRFPLAVNGDSDPAVAGDEAVLIAQKTRVPVVASPDRVAGARRLARDGAKVIVCDDGLQHYRLRRDFELAVVDGARLFGNGRHLPAGPLREPPSRLDQVDAVVVNGDSTLLPGASGMTVTGDRAVNLLTGESRAIASLAGEPVLAVAGIGNPQRFFAMLERHGLIIERREFADHARLSPADLAGPGPVLMTEKDAVKCRTFATEKHWYVPVAAKLDKSSELCERIAASTGLVLNG